jgi:hypothetical protein
VLFKGGGDKGKRQKPKKTVFLGSFLLLCRIYFGILSVFILFVIICYLF